MVLYLPLCCGSNIPMIHVFSSLSLLVYIYSIPRQRRVYLESKTFNLLLKISAKACLDMFFL
jgi:hypothetical protein